MKRRVMVLFGVLGAGCTSPPKILPPRAPPEARTPAIGLPASPVAAGHGRIVLDGTDGPMRISVRADTTFIAPGSQVPATRTGELCSFTPCVADLPVGRYRLFLSSADGRFGHGDTDDVVISEGTTYYIRAPGRYESPTWLAPVPIVLIVAATALVTTGAALASEPSQQTPGFALIGVGAAVGVWGGVEMYDASRAKEQQGATTTWHQ